MMFRYRILKGDSPPNEDDLQQLGTEGWCLVQIVSYTDGWLVYLVQEITQ